MAAPAGVTQAMEVLQAQLGEALLAAESSDTALQLTVSADQLPAAVGILRQTVLAEAHSFCDLCGVEREETLEVIYRFSRLDSDWQAVVWVPLPKKDPVVPSLAELYPGARWPERETAEMFGIRFDGHPDPRPLLLPEGWQGHPLRKDYEYPLEHPYLRPDPLREDPLAALEEPNPTRGEGYEGRVE
jgi:NADH-quinone oxidoreductase subunit C